MQPICSDAVQDLLISPPATDQHPEPCKQVFLEASPWFSHSFSLQIEIIKKTHEEIP